jgi:hypothetical protein
MTLASQSDISTSQSRPLNAFRVLYQHLRATNLTVVAVGQNRKFAQKEMTTQLA